MEVTAAPSRLDARYGRLPNHQATTRKFAWIAAAGFVVVFGAWVIWGGLDGSGDTIDILDTGYSDITDTAITVSWQLTVDPGTATACALQAQNSAHGIVGWRIIELPPSETRTRALSETVVTTEKAVTGLIYRCWLA